MTLSAFCCPFESTSRVDCCCRKNEDPSAFAAVGANRVGVPPLRLMLLFPVVPYSRFRSSALAAAISRSCFCAAALCGVLFWSVLFVWRCCFFRIFLHERHRDTDENRRTPTKWVVSQLVSKSCMNEMMRYETMGRWETTLVSVLSIDRCLVWLEWL